MFLLTEVNDVYKMLSYINPWLYINYPVVLISYEFDYKMFFDLWCFSVQYILCLLLW